MFSDLRERLKTLVFRAREERELDEELRLHIEMETTSQVERGLELREARRQAHLRLGGAEAIKEHVRHARGTRVLDDVLQDLRYGARTLAARPAFTSAVVLSLALGIGANTAIFSLLNALLWRPLPIDRPEDLWAVRTDYRYQEFRVLDADTTVLAGAAAYGRARLNVSIDGSLEPTADGQLVSGGYFSILGVRPAVGRALDVQDDRVPNGHPVAMISDGYWARRFGREPSTLGRIIAISGVPFTIVGITPRGFSSVEVGSAPDIYVPLMMQPAVMPDRENLLDSPIISLTWLRVLVRLRAGSTPEQVPAALGPRVRESFLGPQVGTPPSPSGTASRPADAARATAMAAMADDLRPELVPAGTGLSTLRRYARPLFLLLGLVVLVLLVACANTANLLLARAASRQREFAVRLALGAGRGRLIRQLLVEGVLLALVGGVAGALVARPVANLLVALLSSGRERIALDTSPDLRVLAFTALASLLTGLLFALAPAVRATRVSVAPSLKITAGSRSRVTGVRPDRLLVVTQIALSLVLLVGAALFVRALVTLNARDTGTPRDRILIVRVEPRGSDQRNIDGASERLDRMYRALLERVSSIPGVQSASLAQFTPNHPAGLVGRVTGPKGDLVLVNVPMVYPGYFSTMGIPLVAGRDFDQRDLDVNVRAEGSTPPRRVGIVNETFVRMFYPGEIPVGRPCAPAGNAADPCEIVGVVQDSPYADFIGEVRPARYQPFLQTRTGRGQMALHVRVAGSPSAMIPLIRREVSAVDPTLPLFDVRTLDQEIDAVLVRERLMATLASAFSIAALVLAVVGLYGLLAFIVVRRTAEIGLRVALGAPRARVMGLIMREALLLLIVGVAAGAAGSWALARLARSQFTEFPFGLDLMITFEAAAAMTVVALLAACLPAWRATGIDPVMALRSD